LTIEINKAMQATEVKKRQNAAGKIQSDI